MTPAIKTLCHLFFIYATYLFFSFFLLEDPRLLLINDNIKYHLPNFMYFSGSLVHGYGFPLWYPSNGGVPIGITALNFFPLLPHRVFGYLCALLLKSQDAVTLYKATLVAGVLFAVTGWWLVLHRVTGSRPGATFGALVVLLGGTGITVFHQEQIIATMTWAPWTVLALLRIKEHPAFLIVFAVLFGFSLTVHYPQIQILSFLFLIFALALTGRIDRTLLRSALARKSTLILSSALFLLAASPSLYSYSISGDFSSPLRDMEELTIPSYEEYIRLNTMQYSSATFGYLANYISPKTFVIADQYAFFVTVTGVAFASLGLLLRFRAAATALIVFALCAWAALGVNGYLAQLLFRINFPLIGYFRQWYHFVPMANFCLSALGALGFSALLVRVPVKAGLPRGLIQGVLMAAAFAAVYYEGSKYMGVYSKHYVAEIDNIIPVPAEREYLALVSGNGFELAEQLIVYKEWSMLTRSYPPVIRSPFVANLIYSESGVSDPDLAIKAFCRFGLPDVAVTVDIPVEDEALFPGLRHFSDKFVDSGAAEKVRVGKNYVFMPSGAVFYGSADTTSLAVFPFAHKLKMRALLDGKSVKTYSVFGGAMTGVRVAPGDFKVELSLPVSGYELSIMTQALLLICVIVFSVALNRKIACSVLEMPEKGS